MRVRANNLPIQFELIIRVVYATRCKIPPRPCLLADGTTLDLLESAARAKKSSEREKPFARTYEEDPDGASYERGGKGGVCRKAQRANLRKREEEEEEN